MFINPNKIKNHSYFMHLALLQAHKNLGNTKENPSVGCVITKQNSIISAGSTSFSGRPHAEYNAIYNSKKNLNGAHLYVTLEPCSHYGKTPPCTNLIIKKGIKKVFFSIYDPDLRSKKKSFKILKKRKVVVLNGIYNKEVKLFYKSYLKSKNELLPYVTAKLALSKDYFSINKRKRWITNKFSRGRVHLMRASNDCIITSSKTVKIDDSQLNCRIRGLYNRSPSKIILDKNLRIPLNSKILKESNKFRTIIFYNKNNIKKIKLLKKLNISSHKISLNKESCLDLKEVLLKAKKMGFYRIFLETGLSLTTSFLREKLVDEFKLFISDNKLGKKGDGSFKKNYNLFLKNKKSIKEKINLFNDKLITFRLK